VGGPRYLTTRGRAGARGMVGEVRGKLVPQGRGGSCGWGRSGRRGREWGSVGLKEQWFEEEQG
jgi:hypothetical protein